MRKKPRSEIEPYRIQQGTYRSKRGNLSGAFSVPFRGTMLRVIASNGDGWRASSLGGKPWEHVSVSIATRCPTWEEMAFVKRLFWRDDETVIQFHPPKHCYVDVHPNCLHLWKPPYKVVLPPIQCV